MLFDGVDRHWDELFLILTIGWLAGYFQILGLLALRVRWRNFLKTLELISLKIKTDGVAEERDVNRVVEDIAFMAQHEIKLPMFVLRPLVRKVILRMIENVKKESDSFIAR